jgi:hypothetical protein
MIELNLNKENTMISEEERRIITVSDLMANLNERRRRRRRRKKEVKVEGKEFSQ